MWSALIQVHKIIQKRRPLGIIFHDNKQNFSAISVESNRFKMLLIDSNLWLLIIASIFGLKQALEGETHSDNQTTTEAERKIATRKMVLGSVLYILYITFFIIWFVSAWTLRNRTNSAVCIMNQTMGLYKDRVKNPDTVPGAPSKKASNMFCAVLYNLILSVLGALAAATLIPAISSNNPAEVIFAWILPENELRSWLNLIKVFSCVYIGISSYFSCIPLIQVFCYVTAILFEVKYSLKRAYGSYATKKNVQDLIVKKLNIAESTFHYQWIVYAQYILLVREVNRFGSHIYPDIMITAFCINVGTTMVCMKFYHDLSKVIMTVFLVFDIATWIATVVVHSLAVLAKEECENFHLYWKPRLISKLSQRRLKACRGTGIWVGQFFPFQRTTILNTWDEVVNMVVTLLLAD